MTTHEQERRDQDNRIVSIIEDLAADRRQAMAQVDQLLRKASATDRNVRGILVRVEALEARLGAQAALPSTPL